MRADPYRDNMSRTFQSAFGVKYGTFQQHCLAVAEFASKVSLVRIVKVWLLF